MEKSFFGAKLKPRIFTVLPIVSLVCWPIRNDFLLRHLISSRSIQPLPNGKLVFVPFNILRKYATFGASFFFMCFFFVFFLSFLSFLFALYIVSISHLCCRGDRQSVMKCVLRMRFILPDAMHMYIYCFHHSFHSSLFLFPEGRIFCCVGQSPQERLIQTHQTETQTWRHWLSHKLS